MDLSGFDRLPGTQSVGECYAFKLFVGDALMNMFYPTISMLYTDKMLESAKRIGEMGALSLEVLKLVKAQR